MRALLLDETHPFLERDLERGGLELVRDFDRMPEDFPSDYFEAEVLIVRSRFPIDRDFLVKFSNLKVIGRLGAGLENIDTHYCQSRNIMCHRVPEGNARAVAEQGLGMLLSLLNHIPRAQREVRSGLWIRSANKGTELQSLRVGIIGYGVIGSAFAELLLAMGVRVLSYDKYKKGYAAPGIQEVTLEDLFEKADVVSLHLPLTEETKGYGNLDFFNAFKRPVHFLNTARGPIVRTEDLVKSLKSGQVLSAGLDVLEYEKSSFTSLFEGEMPPPLAALLKMENVIVTPHIAGWTHQAFEKMGEGLAAKVLESLREE